MFLPFDSFFLLSRKSEYSGLKSPYLLIAFFTYMNGISEAKKKKKKKKKRRKVAKKDANNRKRKSLNAQASLCNWKEKQTPKE